LLAFVADFYRLLLGCGSFQHYASNSLYEGGDMTAVQKTARDLVDFAHELAKENDLNFEDLSRAMDLAKVEVDQVHRLKVAAA